MNEENLNQKTAPSVRLKIVGVGGAAMRTVDRLCAGKKFAAEFVAVDTSAAELDGLKSPDIKKVLIGETVTGGSGAGMDATRGAEAAESSKELLREMLTGADMLILVASLGRGTGSGASVGIANLAREIGLFSVCFATNPFAWEGTNSTRQASKAIDALHANCNAFILIENNLIAQSVADGGSLAEGFKISGHWIESGVTACCRMLLNDSGRMRVDLEAFRRLFPRMGARTLFSVGVGNGPSAQEDALSALFRCPLLKTRTSVAGMAETLAIHIEMGKDPNVSLFSETAQRVQDRFGGSMRTLPSYAVNPDLGERVEICVFGAGSLRDEPKVIRAKNRVPAKEESVLKLASDEEPPADGESDVPGFDSGSSPLNLTHGALFEGLELDVPTFVRKQVNLSKVLEKKKKLFEKNG